MLDFGSFINYVMKNVCRYLPEGYESYCLEYLTNKDSKKIEYAGLVFQTSTGSRPAIDLEYFYWMEQAGADGEQVLKALASRYVPESNEMERVFEQIKKNISVSTMKAEV